MSEAREHRSERDTKEGSWYLPLRMLGAREVVALAVLGLATKPFFDVIWQTPHRPVVINTIWAVVLLPALMLVWQDAGVRWLPWSLRQLPFLWLVVLLALVSCLWSPEPVLTLRKSGWLLTMTVVALALGYLLSPRALMGVLMWVFSGVLVAALATALLYPRYAATGNGWQGTTPTHVYLGMIAAAAALFFLVALLAGRLDRRLAWSMLALSSLTVFMARSATGIVMVVVGLGVVVCLIAGRRLRFGSLPMAVTVSIGLTVAAAMAVLHWENTTTLLNKDPTATGRTHVWDDALGVIAQRPLSGYGFGAVWGRRARSYLPEFETTKTAVHAHNGYLQVASQLGLPALAAAVVVLGHMIVRAISGFARWSSAFALFATSYGFMLVVLNFGEARLFDDLFEWLVFVAIATALARAAEGQSPRRTAPARGRSNRLESARRDVLT